MSGGGIAKAELSLDTLSVWGTRSLGRAARPNRRWKKAANRLAFRQDRDAGPWQALRRAAHRVGDSGATQSSTTIAPPGLTTRDSPDASSHYLGFNGVDSQRPLVVVQGVAILGFQPKRRHRAGLHAVEDGVDARDQPRLKSCLTLSIGQILKIANVGDIERHVGLVLCD
jgi:hypothetical protein